MPISGYSVSYFALELDGKHAGWVPKVSGGPGIAVDLTSGAKSFGAARFDDLVLTCGAGMSKAFYDWVASASDMVGGTHRHDAALLKCDIAGKVLSRFELFQALITTISFPALDATSKDRAYLTVKIKPERVMHVSDGVSKVTASFSRPKPWLASGFRLKIAGLEEACAWVSQIAPITITRDVKEDHVGASKLPQLEVGRLSLGDLVISLAEAKAQKFFDWHQASASIDSAIEEKDGTLEFLTPDLKSGLFSLTFSNLNIYEISKPMKTSGAETRNTIVKMACEGIGVGASTASLASVK